MARVVLPSSISRYTGGETELEVAADTVGRLLRELDRRYPGLGRQVDEGMAVAIDGVITQDTHLAAIAPDSEVYIIPKIGGG